MRRTTLPLPALALAFATLLAPVSAQVSDLVPARPLCAATSAAGPHGQIPVLPPAGSARDAALSHPALGAPPSPPAPAGHLATTAPEWLPGETELSCSPRYGADGLDGPAILSRGTPDGEPVPNLQTWGLLLMGLCAVGLAVARYGLHDRPPRVPKRT